MKRSPFLFACVASIAINSLPGNTDTPSNYPVIGKINKFDDRLDELIDEEALACFATNAASHRGSRLRLLHARGAGRRLLALRSEHFPHSSLQQHRRIAAAKAAATNNFSMDTISGRRPLNGK